MIKWGKNIQKSAKSKFLTVVINELTFEIINQRDQISQKFQNIYFIKFYPKVLQKVNDRSRYCDEIKSVHFVNIISTFVTRNKNLEDF